jgi:hypothetical protein
LLAQNSIKRITDTGETIKNIIKDNTSVSTQKIIKQVAEVTIEVAKYSVV